MDYKERLLRRTRTHQSGCVEWLGAVDKDGYGLITYEKRKVRTHRLAFFLENGRWPNPENILHHECENKRCLNLTHLKEVLRVKHPEEHPNLVTMVEKQKTHCKRGHEFTPENTIVTKKGHRNCRTCINEWKRRYTTTPTYREQRNAYDRQRRLES